FAKDVGPGVTDLSTFDSIFKSVQEHGGNTMRFWVHIDGTNSPAWNADSVSGPGQGTIDDLRAILNDAWSHHVTLLLSLWSFDMLKVTDITQLDRNEKLLTDSSYTRKYINNALIPIVKALKGHPGLLGWEVFNEPEGMTTQFGFTGVPILARVPMLDIQRFVNMVAGAIHRTDPDAKVTNGSWSLVSQTDVNLSSSGTQNYNYYRDDRLIAAGGDPKGTLDFYEVHYYDWQSAGITPILHSASTWKLNKPLVIGEFFLPDNVAGVPYQNVYKTYLQEGYAGALVWQWFDWWQNRTGLTQNWPRGLQNMDSMKVNYPNQVTIKLTEPWISSFTASPAEVEAGGASQLSWNVEGAQSVMLDGTLVDSAGTKVVNPIDTTTYTLIATGANNSADTAQVTVYVVPPGKINRALDRPAYSSSNETGLGNDKPSYAFDGNMNTRWSSSYYDNQWIYVDLGKAYNLSSVVLDWETAYASGYDIDVSLDGQNWTTAYHTDSGDGGVDSLTFSSPPMARYVRMYGIKRATQWGFSLWEFKVFGSLSSKQPPDLTLVEPDRNRNLGPGANIMLSATATDTDGSIQYVSFSDNGTVIDTVKATPYILPYKNLQEGQHIIFARTLDSDGLSVQSAPDTINVLPTLETKTLEAEDATLTGSNTAVENQVVGASGGKYVNMNENNGVITWNNLGIMKADNYDVHIRYYLPFDYKTQILAVNGDSLGEMYFKVPKQQWLPFDTTITAQNGINSI
ncbi:MAG TPA: discoidin domain-containing protein, partial [Balneolales bacterium]|nr:discoidin domain-containing protein [Balneolales bacterium]